MREYSLERWLRECGSDRSYLFFGIAVIACSLALGAITAWADPPDTLWTRTYGGANIDVGHDVQQASDLGFVVTGYTRSYGASGHNLWLFKTTSAGDLQWNHAFGGNSDDEGQAVAQTSDGGYVAAGFTESYGAGGKDVWLVKVDAEGEETWTQYYGGSSDDEAYSVRETVDGGLIIAGATSSYGTGSRDMWLIKTDESGNLVWSQTFGGYGSDGAWSVTQTKDDGFVLAGWTYSYGPGSLGNAWLVKTDSLGVMEWNQAFGGTDVDRGYEARQTTDGGYIMAGYTGSFGAGLYDVYLLKTDSDGSEQWSRTFGGTGRDYANDVVQTADGGYLAAGYTLSYGAGGDDMYLVRTDADGNLVWDVTYGGSASDVAYAAATTLEGGYVVVGHTLSSGAGLHDAWVIRLAPEGASTTPPPLAIRSLTLDVRPNPFSRFATIRYDLPGVSTVSLSVHDASGWSLRTIEDGAGRDGDGNIVWDGRDQSGRRVAPGIYFCRLEAGGSQVAVKVVRVDD